MREKITIDDLGKNNLAGYTELILQKLLEEQGQRKVTQWEQLRSLQLYI